MSTLRRRWLPTALVAVPVALLLQWMSLCRPAPVPDETGRPCLGFCEEPHILEFLVVAAAAAILVLWVWGCLRRFGTRPYATAVVAVGLTALCGTGFVTSLFGTFEVHLGRASLTTGGVTYRYGWDWDGGVWLAREVGRRTMRTLVVQVAWADDDDYELAHLIRPLEAPPSDFDFAVDPDGRVFALRGTACLIAFDPRVKPENTEDVPQGVPAAVISPFALLGAADTGKTEDVEEFIAAIRKARDAAPTAEKPWYAWYPKEPVLLAALESPNPWVRETAARFVREGGATLYPAATKRL